MTGGLNFAIEIDATDELARDADRVDALITVTASAFGQAGGRARLAVVLIMDRSLSMIRAMKMPEAQRAACAAIDALPDGALLAIIAGNRKAETVFPARGGLAVVDARAKKTAKRLVMGLRPDGGTAIGRWLTAAGQAFAAEPAAGAICHAVLYTDGKNEHETPEELSAALDSCADGFTCDVRGLGDDWDYRELLHISEALHGDATAVLQIADLAKDFTELVERAQRLMVPRAYLRLRPGKRFAIASFAQTHPVLVDLTGRLRRADGSAMDAPLGSWQPGTRHYELTLRFTPDTLPFDEDLRAARVELLAETAAAEREVSASAALVVRRFATPGSPTIHAADPLRSGKERQLLAAMQACADAWLDRRYDDADAELGDALRLAREVDDPRRLRLLESAAVIGHDGVPRARSDVSPGTMQQIGLDATKTGTLTARPHRPAPVPAAGPVGQPPDQPVGQPRDQSIDPPGGQPAEVRRTCRACGQVTTARYVNRCEACGEPFGGQASP